MCKRKINDPLQYAIEKAREISITTHKQRVFAVCVDKKGYLISESANSYTKSHPVQAKYAKMSGNAEAIFPHAEVGCLVKAQNNQAYKIYVARVNKKGEAVLAKPCKICQMAISMSTIEEVYFTV